MMYYGKSKDGSDAKEFEGAYVSSCGNFWGSEPFTPQSEKQMRRSQWKQRVKDLRNKR